MPGPAKFRPSHADPVQDLFGRPAGWMLYWGSTIVVMLLLVFVGLAAFIRYPDRVVTIVQISTPVPPASVVARMTAPIAQLLVADAGAVQPGDVLLVLDNPANYVHLQQLDRILHELVLLDTPTAVLASSLPAQLELGELGRDYAQLLNYATELRYRLARSNSGQRAQLLDKQLQHTAEIQANLDTQLLIQRQELAIAGRNAQQFRELAARSSASQLELDAAETRYLQALRQVQEQDNRRRQNQRQREALLETRLALEEQLSDQVMMPWLGFQATVRQLRQGWQEWEARFLLRAPVSGQVTYYQALAPGLLVQENQVLLGIVPAGAAGTWVAEGILNGSASGKIAVGDTAYLQLEAFPYREFGQVAARVQQLALAPQPAGGGYRILLELPSGLTTTYGKTLPFRQQMRAQGIILGEKRSLLARLLDRLRSGQKNE